MRIPKQPQGFILVATLWILAGMTIAASSFALWTQQALDLATQSAEDTQAALDLQSTKVTVLYLLGTQYMRAGGLLMPTAASKTTEKVIKKELLKLDNQIYEGLGQTRFALQDARGLVSVGILHKKRIRRLLGLIGIPAEDKNPLLAKLLDYVDRDDLKRLNGAESVEYIATQRMPPNNHYLRTPEQVANILHWDKQAALWQKHDWSQLTTVLSANFINLNTASITALQVLPGMSTKQAEKIVSKRQQNAFNGELQLLNALGGYIGFDILETIFFPGYGFRFSLWQEDSLYMKQYHFYLTPNSDIAPWQVKYAIESPIHAFYQNSVLPINSPLPPYSVTP
ncbi:type II secretion system minor pseudopilin [Candidatus Venteria ishoeyi]|uniref:General secretion pathway protein K n=1 Tax=Candidatus Venteria ishoeyi TaxID=1899563 RepID=A0A1H6F6T9_9GAMM|nr:helix-hairpin-helix domain-containing protein [Candidatus Venteria ishoeyi]SEH04806.1 General secretion pathway protein K [Candidatus Venteria ishoeyi]